MKKIISYTLTFLRNATQRNATQRNATQRTFSVLVLALLFSLFFATCAKEISVTKIFTITFNTNGGSTIDPITVNDNTTSVSTPATPTKANYAFVGWYFDEALTKPIAVSASNLDFTASPITSNITLYAKWKSALTLTFNTNGGSAIDVQTIEPNAKATKPTDPTREGYTFVGWYSDEGFTTVFDFNTPISARITIYAKWQELVQVTSYVLPSNGITGLSADINAMIDEATLTITVAINMEASKRGNLGNITPTIAGHLGSSQSAKITNYYLSSGAEGTPQSIGTYTLTRQDGSTKSYQVKLVYASLVLTLPADASTTGVTSYAIQIYKPKFFSDGNKSDANNELMDKVDIPSTASMPYYYAPYLPSGTYSGQRVSVLIYAKAGNNDTLAAYYVERQTTQGNTASTLLQSQSLTADRTLFITYTDKTGFTYPDGVLNQQVSYFEYYANESYTTGLQIINFLNNYQIPSPDIFYSFFTMVGGISLNSNSLRCRIPKDGPDNFFSPTDVRVNKFRVWTGSFIVK